MDPKKTVLLVIDIQNDFCHKKGFLGKHKADLSDIQSIVPKLKKFIKICRKNGILIIFTKEIESKEISPNNLKKQFENLTLLCHPNSWGADLYKLKPQKEDIILEKKTYDAFSNPNLNKILKKSNIQNLIVTGVNTDVCIDSTIRRAFTEGYNLIIVEDLIATHNLKVQNNFIELFKKFFGSVKNSSEIISIISKK